MAGGLNAEGSSSFSLRRALGPEVGLGFGSAEGTVDRVSFFGPGWALKGFLAIGLAAGFWVSCFSVGFWISCFSAGFCGSDFPAGFSGDGLGVGLCNSGLSACLCDSDNG